MNKAILGALVCTVLGGCVSTKQVALAPGVIPEATNKKLAVAIHEQPTFMAMTAGKGAFALLGAAAAASEGKQLVAENKVSDPAQRIATELSDGLKTKLGLAEVAVGEKLVADGDPQALAALFPNADLALHVESTGWGFLYFPTDWTHYRVQYGVKTRLIDLKKREVVAESFCGKLSDETAKPPTYDELLNNQASGLKAELAAAGDFCLKKAKSEVYAL